MLLPKRFAAGWRVGPRSTSVGAKKLRRTTPGLETVEDRVLMSTIIVSNLNDSGAGSLRRAIIDSNAAPGSDLITFSVAGTIALTSAKLPDITSPVDINATTAPNYAGAPVVALDANGFAGLTFALGSG